MQLISPKRQREIIVHFVEEKYRENIEKRHPRLTLLFRFIHFFYTGKLEDYWIRLKVILNYMKIQHGMSDATTVNRLDEIIKPQYYRPRDLQSAYIKGARLFSPPVFPIPFLFGLAVSLLLTTTAPLVVHSTYSSLPPMLGILWLTCIIWFAVDWRTRQ